MQTSFQQAHIQSIRNRIDFKQFVDCQMTAEEAKAVAEYTGPFNVLFYTQDNVLHLQRLGQRRLLLEVTS